MKDRDSEGLLNKQAELELMGKLSQTLQEDKYNLKPQSNTRMETELKLVHTYRKRVVTFSQRLKMGSMKSCRPVHKWH